MQLFIRCEFFLLKDRIAESVREMIEAFGTQRYIANLGHGIYPDMNPDHLKEFVDAVHKHSENANGIQ